MTDDEKKEMVVGLATSPDFFSALQTCIENVNGEEINLREVGLWFFYQGYLARMNFEEKKKMTFPYKYDHQKIIADGINHVENDGIIILNPRGKAKV